MKNENTIGKIIARFREKKGYTQQQLCYKICSVSTLAKIESGINIPEHFLLNRLLERLGQSTAKLEYILSHKEYEQYEFQYQIHEKMCQGCYDKVKELICQYVGIDTKNNNLKWQYVEQVESQILWQQGRLEEALEKLNKAIGRTMEPMIDWEECKYVLSAEEVRLHLLKWELSVNLGEERKAEELLGILRYIERYHGDVEERVKVYPYVVILLGEKLSPYKNSDILKPYISNALEMLRSEGRLVFMPEIMQLYISVLKEIGGYNREAEKIQGQLNTVRSLIDSTNIKLEHYRLVPIWDKEYSLDYEMIRRQRKVRGITQLELSEGVCEPETLSRIESGKRRPSHKHYEMLIDKLGRDASKVQMGITAREIEAVSLKRKIDKLLHRLEWDKAEAVLLELEEKLDINVVENLQYIMKNRIYLQNVKGELANAEARKEFENLLALSLGDTPILELPQYALSRLEINLLNNIAITYMMEKRREEAIDIYEAILQGYQNSVVKEIFHIREIDTAMANLADLFEEVDCFDRAIKLSRDRIQLSLLLGKGNDIGRALTTIAFTMERQGNRNCKIYYKQALDMLDLMDMRIRYQAVKNHLQSIS